MTGWLVTGAGGMLGRDLVDVLGRQGEDVTGLWRGDLDVTDESAVRALILRAQPAVVVNCAAWTAVDDAEAREDEALLVNGRGAENLAAACATSGSRLVHVSTDYVFGGDGRAPYAEYDGTAPRTAYGRTKLAGEQAVLGLLPETGYVVRTAWLYGAHGPNFVRTMIALEGRAAIRRCRRLTSEGSPPGRSMSPTRSSRWSRAAPPAGVYHATSSGEATWYELAVRSSGCSAPTWPGYGRPRAPPSRGRRRGPAYSVLGHDRHAAAGVKPIGDWRTALSRAWPVLAAAAGARAAPPRGVGQAVGVVGE